MSDLIQKPLSRKTLLTVWLIERDIKKGELAGRIGTSPENLNHILKRPTAKFFWVSRLRSVGIPHGLLPAPKPEKNFQLP